MGNALGISWNFWKLLGRRKEFRILMVGLDAAGKTTILFKLKNIRLVDSIEDCEDAPKIILASSDTMYCGFSKQLFMKYCTQQNNLVIFTSERSIYEVLKHHGRAEFEVRQRVPLKDEELDLFRQQEAFKREKQLADTAFEAIIKKKAREGKHVG